MRRRLRATALTGALLVCLAPVVGAAPALGPDGSVPALTAAFLLNFVKFTTWPAEAMPRDSSVVICVDDAAVASELKSMTAGRAIDGHPVTVRATSTAGDRRACHVWYVGEAGVRRPQAIVDELHGAPVLTVGGTAEFADRGGVIGLYVKDARMRFVINASAAKRVQLTISSRLLSLGRAVQESH